MRHSFFAVVVSLLVGALASGCNQSTQSTAIPPQPNAGIAIIDLDEIARQLGSDKQIVSAIQKRQAALNSKLSDLAKSYTAEFKKQQETVEAESEQAAVQLASYQKQVNASFNQAKAQAQQNLSQHRSQLVNKFRDAVRPAARKVASKRGLSVIVTRQDSLLYDYSAESDITSEVIEVLRGSAAPKPSTTAAENKQS